MLLQISFSDFVHNDNFCKFVEFLRVKIISCVIVCLQKKIYIFVNGVSIILHTKTTNIYFFNSDKFCLFN